MRTSVVWKCLIAGIVGLALFAFAPETSLAVPDQPAPQPKPKSKSKSKSKQKAKKKKQKDASADQDRIYNLGYWQAKAGDHAASLATLRAAPDQADPRVQTMIGFALRKLGRVDEAMPYYLRAVATRPNATTTRQYLGEAYLQMGDVTRAREQLAEIGRLCGTVCEDYTLLSAEIARYEGRPG
jgi:tetratricopeptide (TPR) repeat protein